jgi:hypothetical protein
MQTGTNRGRASIVTREIARSEWPNFFDEFSRRHRGWLVNIEVFGSLGAQVEANGRPLNGIVAEERKGSFVIEIFTGSAPGETLTHTIDRPTRVQVEETGEGAEAAVQIESQDEGRTLVQFRAVALPETVDGLPGH